LVLLFQIFGACSGDILTWEHRISCEGSYAFGSYGGSSRKFEKSN